MKFSSNGFMAESLTLNGDSSLNVGEIVKISDNNTVSSCTGSDSFCGIISHEKNGICAVQLHGAVTVPFTGTAPGVGYQKLCADGAKGVKSGSGREYLVLSVDNVKSTVTFVL